MNIPVFWEITSHTLVKFINTSQEYNASIFMAVTPKTAVSNQYHIHVHTHIYTQCCNSVFDTQGKKSQRPCGEKLCTFMHSSKVYFRRVQRTHTNKDLLI